jgi:predicted GIY-YIG superfamily endonuclease
MQRGDFVYFLSNYTRSLLYIGATSNLHRRLHEVVSGQLDGFTKRYRV